MKNVTIKLNVAVNADKVPSDVNIEQLVKENIKRLCSADGGIFDGADRACRSFQVTVLEPEDF